MSSCGAESAVCAIDEWNNEAQLYPVKASLSPASRRAAALVALALAGGAVSFAAFAVTFSTESSYLGAVGETTPDVGLLATAAAVAGILLVADIAIGVALVAALRRLLFAFGVAISVIEGLGVFWMIGPPTTALRAYPLAAVPVPLGLVASLAGATALLGLVASLVGWMATPAQRTWLESAPSASPPQMPPQTHQA